MHVEQALLEPGKAVKLFAAAVVGLSLGTLVPPDPLALPAAGTVPALPVGVAGLAVGTALYVRGPALVGASGCGCGGDCDCA
jgi:hypothetical protein